MRITRIEATRDELAAALDPLRDYPPGVLAAWTELLREEFPLRLPGGQIADDVAVVIERFVKLASDG